MAKVRATAVLSMNPITKQAKASDTSSSASCAENRGIAGQGRPGGTSWATSTPRAATPSQALTAIEATTVPSTTTPPGSRVSRTRISTSAPTPKAALSRCVSPKWAAIAATREKKPPASTWMPSRWGICLEAMVSATPALKPIRIGSEMKLTSWFRRRSQAPRLRAATINAVAPASWP
jgi:hypothetical protein